jgi:thymidine phosphorylase
MVVAQGGDKAVVEDYERLPAAGARVSVEAASSGYVKSIDALGVGVLSVELGAGRSKLGDRLDPAAGFLFRRKVGDRVEKGDVVVEVLGKTRRRVRDISARLAACIAVSRAAPRNGGRVLARLTKS